MLKVQVLFNTKKLLYTSPSIATAGNLTSTRDVTV